MDLSIPLCELRGSPQAIGHAHGEAYRDQIRELAQLLWENLSAYCPLSLSRDTLLNVNMKHLPFTEEYGPDLVEEMRGIAEGSGVRFEEIFFLNSAFNLINLGDIRSALPLLGCTCFGVSPEATRDGKSYVGENYDTFKFFERYTLVLKVSDGVHPSALVYTIPGVLAHAGMNEVGLGVNVNYLCANDGQFGRIPAVIIRKALQSERIGDAITAVISGKRASGANYVLGDRDGNLLSIETSSGNYDLLFPVDGVIGHANHYRSALMRPYQIDRPVQMGDSILRDARMNRLLREKKGNLDVTQLMGMLRDHSNFPSSVCFHGRKKEATSEGEVFTVASMIQELSTQTLYISKGVPCRGEFQRFSM